MATGAPGPERTLGSHVRNKLAAGLLAAIPVALTILILWYLDQKTRALFGLNTPLLGIVIALVVIYLLGLFVTSLLGQWVLHAADRLLNHIPGLRDLYRSWKQVALTTDGHDGVFAHVVVVRDETGQFRMVGFSSGRPIDGDPHTLCVFVPASPNPTSGRLYFVRLEDCTLVDVPTQAVLKMLISGGNFVPAAIGEATARLAAPGSRKLGV